MGGASPLTPPAPSPPARPGLHLPARDAPGPHGRGHGRAGAPPPGPPAAGPKGPRSEGLGQRGWATPPPSLRLPTARRCPPAPPSALTPAAAAPTPPSCRKPIPPSPSGGRTRPSGRREGPRSLRRRRRWRLRKEGRAAAAAAAAAAGRLVLVEGVLVLDLLDAARGLSRESRRESHGGTDRLKGSGNLRRIMAVHGR